MRYRKEIDGLRAVAVLPVIFFHAGLSGFDGGYVGVDIFFVISGYLITSIILEEKKNGTFSIVHFYERRARRILPALSAVLACTTVAAYLFMSAEALKDYSLSLVYVATFASNIYFYLTSGYFSSVSEEKPLLHMWSLAVEEQYYLIFPLLIILLWPLGRKGLVICLAVAASMSLILAQFLASSQSVDANFYLLPSRAWELLAGAGIALVPWQDLTIAHWKREASGCVGAAMIAYSIVFFDGHTPFPSFFTLMPVLGACLIIGGVDSTTWVGRLLSKRSLVFIGLISYSLYLWHQPMLALLRQKSIGRPPSYLVATAILASFGLAALSWKYVEAPFRSKDRFSRGAIFRYSALSIAISLIIGWAGYSNDGFSQRFDAKDYSDSIQHSPKREECHTEGRDYLKPERACRYYGEKVTWAIMGDSHAVEPAYGLARKLEGKGEGVVHLSFSGCPPALLFDVRLPGCTEWTGEALRYLENETTIENVLLAYRYSVFLFGRQFDAYPEVPNVDPRYQFLGTYGSQPPEVAREVYWESFATIVSRLSKAGKKVYVLYPIPDLPVRIGEAVAQFSILSSDTMMDLRRSTSAEYYFERNEFILGKLDQLPFGEGLHAVKPFEILCDGIFCPAIRDDKALYFDDNHLSVFGSEVLVEGFLGQE